jgi:hypothetical protein
MKEEIEKNTLESIETLKYILEVNLGNFITDIEAYPSSPVINGDELIEITCDYIIHLDFPDPDLTQISLKLKKLDAMMALVFDNHYLTYNGKLVKKDYSGQDKMAFSYLVYSINYLIETERVQVSFGVISVDI